MRTAALSVAVILLMSACSGSSLREIDGRPVAIEMTVDEANQVLGWPRLDALKLTYATFIALGSDDQSECQDALADLGTIELPTVDGYRDVIEREMAGARAGLLDCGANPFFVPDTDHGAIDWICSARIITDTDPESCDDIGYPSGVSDK